MTRSPSIYNREAREQVPNVAFAGRLGTCYYMAMSVTIASVVYLSNNLGKVKKEKTSKKGEARWAEADQALQSETE